MKPNSKWFVVCDKFTKDGADFTIHAHRRRLRRKVGLIMVLGHNGHSVIVPSEVVDDADALTDVMSSSSYIEVMSKLRRHDAYDESVHNTWHWESA